MTARHVAVACIPVGVALLAYIGLLIGDDVRRDRVSRHLAAIWVGTGRIVDRVVEILPWPGDGTAPPAPLEPAPAAAPGREPVSVLPPTHTRPQLWRRAA